MTVTTTTPLAGAAAAASKGSAATLSGNFQDFLKLLMTQLRNQDPTSPMDTNQFTNQLVQFASVEQQINANASLTKLVQASQGNEVLQSAALVGKRVELSADHLALQNGTAALHFTTTAAQPVSIAVYNEAGVKLRDATVNSTAGSNRWSWDGRDSQGRTVPDGSYRAVVAGSGGGAVPFTVEGTVTGVSRADNAVMVRLGDVTAEFDRVKALSGG